MRFIKKKVVCSQSNFESYLMRPLWLDSGHHHRASSPHFSSDGPLNQNFISQILNFGRCQMIKSEDLCDDFYHMSVLEFV